VVVGGEAVEADGKVLCDYIQTESNIISGKYKLEENFITMKKRSVFNFIAGALTLALAVCLKLYCVFENIDAKFFDFFSVALGVTGIVFFVSEIVQRNKAHREYREELDMAVMEQYGVKTIPTLYVDGTKINKLSEINKWINEQVGKNNG
jgi:hypothetical protein